jgi:hypothetical protein
MLDFDGAPVGFNYQGKSFLVASRPVRWYSRRLWWEDAAAAPKGAGAALLEVEMWRLWAASGELRFFFELRHQRPEDRWEVSQLNSQ